MTPDITSTTIVRATPAQVSAQVAGETVILGLHDNVYYGLDAVGTRVWQMLAEPMTAGDIVAALVAEYDVDPARCESDILALLQDLAAHALIEARPAE